MSETKGLTNDLLKDKMVDVVCKRYYPADLDVVTMPGIYQVGAGTTNGRPEGIYGVMAVLASSSFVLQIIYGQNGEQIQRIMDGNHVWGSWYRTILAKMT